MIDRELLEAAAKAAGIEGVYGLASDDFYYQGNTEGILTTLPNGQSYVWNPLTDDGDALRLAVKLGMCFGIAPHRVALDKISLAIAPGTAEVECLHAGDAYAASRRAIVMAAAEIGRDME